MEYMESRMQDQIEGVQHTYASMCEEIERLGNSLAERQAHWRDAMAEIEWLRGILHAINRRSSPNPERTFDVSIRDLDEITALARSAMTPNAEIKPRA